MYYYCKRGKIRWARHSRFQPYEFFWKYFCGALATSVYDLPIATENICSTLKNHENRESLAQQIFPHLQCIMPLNIHRV